MEFKLVSEKKIYSTKRYSFSLEGLKGQLTLKFHGSVKPTIKDCAQIIFKLFENCNKEVTSIVVEVQGCITCQKVELLKTDNESDIIFKLSDVVVILPPKKIID